MRRSGEPDFRCAEKLPGEVGEVLNLVYCWWLHGLPLVQMRRLVRIAEMSRQEFIRGHCPQEQP